MRTQTTPGDLCLTFDEWRSVQTVLRSLRGDELPAGGPGAGPDDALFRAANSFPHEYAVFQRAIVRHPAFRHMTLNEVLAALDERAARKTAA